MRASADAPALMAAVAALVVLGPGRRSVARVSTMVRTGRGARRPLHPAPTTHRRAGPGRLGRSSRVPSPVAAFTACTAIAAIAAITGCVGRLVRSLARRPVDEASDRRVGAVVLAAALVGLANPVLIVPVALVVWVTPTLRQRSVRRRRQDRIAAEIPDLVELFRLAIAAGLTVHQAAAAVGSRAQGITGAAVAIVPRRVAGGERLADALDRLVDVDEAMRPLASALASAERYGVPLGSTLERLALESRLARRRRAEEVARRLPVQMLFPLVLCILPAFALLSVVPLVLAALRDLPH